MKTLETLTAAGTRRMGTFLQVTMPRSPAGFEHVHRAWNRHGGWPVSTCSCREKKISLKNILLNVQGKISFWSFGAQCAEPSIFSFINY